MLKPPVNTTRAAETVTIYEPDNSIHKGYISICMEIYREIIGSRWLIYQLFKREFFSKYKQSFTGILWSFIIPIITIATIMILNRSGLFTIEHVDVPYPLYAVLGMAFWQLFSIGLIGASNSLVEAGPMIVKINFSKKSLVIASMGQALVSVLVQFLLVGALFVWYGFLPHIYIILVPFVLIPILLLTLGLGFILSLLNGITRDVGSTLSLLMTFFMFLTPVLYAKPAVGILASISRYNPVYYLVAVPRDLVLRGVTSEWTGYGVSTGIAIAVFILCVFIFHITEARVTERI